MATDRQSCGPHVGQRTELASGLAGMILGRILNEKQVLRGLVQDLLQKGLVLVTVELAIHALEKQSSRGVFDQAQYLVTLAFATRLDHRLVAPGGSRYSSTTSIGQSCTRRRT